jgi:hypothetical protein
LFDWEKDFAILVDTTQIVARVMDTEGIHEENFEGE